MIITFLLIFILCDVSDKTISSSIIMVSCIDLLGGILFIYLSMKTNNGELIDDVNKK